MSGKILVLGATGNVGKPLVKLLVAKGEIVKAASRQGKSLGGVEGAAFDFAKPETIEGALQGVDRVYALAPGGTIDPRPLLLPVMKAAAGRKIKVVLQSVLGVDADDSIPYRQVEIALEKSGTPYVILRPNWFSDNFLNFWKPGIAHGEIAVPAADGKTSFIDVRDVAGSAAAVLTTNRFDGKAFNLTGPDAMSYAEAAKLIAQAIGKPVGYRSIDDSAFIEMLSGAGVPKEYAAFLASIFYPVREGWTAAVTDAVETLTGKAPRSVQSYVQDNKAALAA